MSEDKFTKNYKVIAGFILAGVDPNIYSIDRYENNYQLRDEIESTLIEEFGIIEEMYSFIECFMLNIPNIADDAEKLLAKARGE